MYLYSSHLRHLRIGFQRIRSICFLWRIEADFPGAVPVVKENHYSVKQKREWLHPVFLGEYPANSTSTGDLNGSHPRPFLLAGDPFYCIIF